MKSPFFTLVLALILNATLVLFLVPVTWLQSTVNKESKALVDYIPQSGVLESTNSRFTGYIIDSGLLSSLQDHFLPVQVEQVERIGDNVYVPYMANRLEAFQYFSYQVILRLSAILEWLPYVVFMLFPAIYDAFNVWEIKKTNFDFNSPIIHWISMTTAEWTTGLMLLLICLPFALSPLVIPIYLFIMCMVITFALSHTQKRL